ncbi:uncharacterized protein LOC111630474 [Centruroides sculpturatus]|uniref:uncharacterized protein LOC111630474 n=1 Tax=Centruroides sculpturatus TaxID=218467 RepID=UPI000C6D49A9|nr:uncharacterized protein LOC111630474 [Centruroides sculpturatus]
MLGRLVLSDEDEEEEKERSNLVEDDSALSSRVGGTLRFNEPQKDTSEIETIRTWSKTSQCSSSSSGDMSSPKRSSQRVTFEIVSAKTVSQTRKKFVFTRKNGEKQKQFSLEEENKILDNAQKRIKTKDVPDGLLECCVTGLDFIKKNFKENTHKT